MVHKQKPHLHYCISIKITPTQKNPSFISLNPFKKKIKNQKSPLFPCPFLYVNPENLKRLLHTPKKPPKKFLKKIQRKKKMKREHPFGKPDQPSITGKSKMFEEKEEAVNGGGDGGMDELLAVLGYKVKSTDMADVAHKLEQLAQVMGNVEEPGLSHLASDTVHYNPSDLYTWLGSMLSELNPSGSNPDSSILSCDLLNIDPFLDSDLKAIPGKAILTPPPQPQNSCSDDNNSGISSITSCSERKSKRVKQCVNLNENNSGISRPVVVIDSQENGIRLVHTLMACAESIQQENFGLAEALVKQIGYLAASQAGSMRKVATYFAEALARRIYKLHSNSPFDHNLSETLEMNFYESCPYLKFAHFTANQAILEAFAGKKRVHVIDFSMKQGMQWPPLLLALALRPEGPPFFRLTGIGPPAPDNSDRLQEVGWKLAQFAESINIKFQYRGFVAKSLTDLESGLLDLKPEDEVIAVNSIFELHRLLGKPGGIEKVLGLIKDMNPVIVTVVEQEANHNGPVFLDRFNESLHYYSTLFDSLERCADSDDKVMSEVYLGKQICNVVACEGVDRFERHESLVQWRTRFGSCGFDPVHLGSNAFKQASELLEYFAGRDGYGVEEREGCLMLGWHSRPLITTSAWKLGVNSVS